MRFNPSFEPTETGKYTFRYPFGPDEVVDFFITYYGPANRAYAALDATGNAAMQSDLEQLWVGSNQAKDGTSHVESEYLGVQARRA